MYFPGLTRAIAAITAFCQLYLIAEEPLEVLTFLCSSLECFTPVERVAPDSIDSENGSYIIPTENSRVS